MRNKILSLTTAFIIIAISTLAIAKPNSGTMTLQSNSSQNLGNVEITVQGGTPVYQYVPCAGTYSLTVNYAPTAVVINGYATMMGQIGYAILPNGTSVKVDFSNGSSIVVQDQSVMQ